MQTNATTMNATRSIAGVIKKLTAPATTTSGGWNLQGFPEGTDAFLFTFTNELQMQVMALTEDQAQLAMTMNEAILIMDRYFAEDVTGVEVYRFMLAFWTRWQPSSAFAAIPGFKEQATYLQAVLQAPAEICYSLAQHLRNQVNDVEDPTRDLSLYKTESRILNDYMTKAASPDFNYVLERARAISDAAQRAQVPVIANDVTTPLAEVIGLIETAQKAVSMMTPAVLSMAEEFETAKIWLRAARHVAAAVALEAENSTGALISKTKSMAVSALVNLAAQLTVNSLSVDIEYNSSKDKVSAIGVVPIENGSAINLFNKIVSTNFSIMTELKNELTPAVREQIAAMINSMGDLVAAYATAVNTEFAAPMLTCPLEANSQFQDFAQFMASVPEAQPMINYVLQGAWLKAESYDPRALTDLDVTVRALTDMQAILTADGLDNVAEVSDSMAKFLSHFGLGEATINVGPQIAKQLSTALSLATAKHSSGIRASLDQAGFNKLRLMCDNFSVNQSLVNYSMTEEGLADQIIQAPSLIKQTIRLYELTNGSELNSMFGMPEVLRNESLKPLEVLVSKIAADKEAGARLDPSEVGAVGLALKAFYEEVSDITRRIMV